MTLASCPVCQSSATVEGRVLADGSEDGHAEKFFPSGLRLLTLRRSVRLTGRQAFKACTQCGHVWNTLDATGLRELIDRSATEDLKRKLEAKLKAPKSERKG
jgi:hypothetical protein